MSKLPMRGQFRHLHFKTFPMTPRTPQWEVFWPFNSSSEFSGVPEDSKFPFLGVWASPSHLAQSGAATLWLNDIIYNINKIGLQLCGKVNVTTLGEYTVHSSLWMRQLWWCTMFFVLIASMQGGFYVFYGSMIQNKCGYGGCQVVLNISIKS
jgi:hypothetical protein